MRFDDDHDEQPATVARVMADFALALILILVMLVGTRSGAQADPRAASRAATRQPDGTKADLNLALTHTGKFMPSAAGNAAEPVDGATIARQWMSSNTQAPAIVVVEFPTNALASTLHQALLELQFAFGTNSLNLQTIPDSPK